MDLVSIGCVFVFIGTRVGTEVERLEASIETGKIDSIEIEKEETGKTDKAELEQGFSDGIEEELSEQWLELDKTRSAEGIELDWGKLKEEIGSKEEKPHIIGRWSSRRGRWPITRYRETRKNRLIKNTMTWNVNFACKNI